MAFYCPIGVTFIIQTFRLTFLTSDLLSVSSNLRLIEFAELDLPPEFSELIKLDGVMHAFELMTFPGVTELA